MVRVRDCAIEAKYSGLILVEGVKVTMIGVVVVICPVISNYMVSSLVAASKARLLTSVLSILTEKSALFCAWVDCLNTYKGGNTDTFIISVFSNLTRLKEITCMIKVPLKEQSVLYVLVSTVQLKSGITWHASSQPS